MTALLAGTASFAAQPSSPTLLLSDLDGDGATDSITVEVGFDESAPRLGRITAVSGATGQTLYTILGEAANDRFGFAVRLADLDGDGAAELLASAPNAPGAAGAGTGRVYIFSGATGQQIRAIVAGDGLRIGTGLDTVADQDGDGLAELLVEGAAASGGWQGRTFIYSGASGELLAARKATVGGIQRAVASGGRAYQAGDLDDSGVIDAHDVALIASAIAGGGDATHDVNRDGIVDAGDLVAVVEALARGERTMAGAGIVTEISGESAGMEARWSEAHAGDALSLSWSQVTHNAAGDGSTGGGDQPPDLVDEGGTPPGFPGLIPCACEGGVIASIPGMYECFGLMGGCPDQSVLVGTTVHLNVPGNCTLTIAGDGVQYESLPGNVIRPLSAGCISVKMTCMRDGECCGCQICRICAYEEIPPCEARVDFLNCPEQPVAIDALDDLVLHTAGLPRAMWVDGVLTQGGYEWAIQVSDCAQLCPDYVNCPDCPEGCPVSYYAPFPSTEGVLRLADHPAFETLNPAPGQCLWVRVRYRFDDQCNPPDCCQGPWDCCHAVATCKFPLYERDPTQDIDGDGYCDWEEVDGQDRPVDRVIDADRDLLSRHTDVRGVTEYVPAPPGFQPPWEPAPYRERFDTDGDGVQDIAELRLGLSPEMRYTTSGTPDRYTAAGLAADTDQDLTDDVYEGALGLDPTVRDTDGDGIVDGIELRAGTDPTVNLRHESADTDGDGLCDYEELFVYGTQPDRVDTDGDGLTDFFEARAGLDPRTPHSEARVIRIHRGGTNYDYVYELGVHDADSDGDFDGLSAYLEQVHDTDPTLPDSDGDGVGDGEEVATGGSPTDPSDGGRRPPDGEVCWMLVTIGTHLPSGCGTTDDGYDPRPPGPGDGTGPGIGHPDDVKLTDEWTVEIVIGDLNGDGDTEDPGERRRIRTGNNGERTTLILPFRRGHCYPITLGGRHIRFDHRSWYFSIRPVNREVLDEDGRPSLCSPEDDCCCMAIDDPDGVFGNHCCSGGDPNFEQCPEFPATATMCLPLVDLIIDADNSAGLGGGPDDHRADAAANKQRGGIKLVLVNRDDADGDGVLDFADGFDRDPALPQDDTSIGVTFTPVILRASGLTDEQRANATITFSYDAADPAAVTVTPRLLDGLDGVTTTLRDHTIGLESLRLWRADGGTSRTVADFVRHGQAYTMAELLSEHQDNLILFVEAVTGSATPVSITATLTTCPPIGCLDPTAVKVLPLDPLTGIDVSVDQHGIIGYTLFRGTGGTIAGTDGHDIIFGTDESDEINGYAGNDIILPGAGDDLIDSGADSDLIFSWRGSKRIVATPGEDTVSYMAGNVLGAPQLSNQTTENPSSYPTPSRAGTAQPFTSPHIIAAYRWAFGDDDIWHGAFDAGGGQVLAVEGDGHFLWSYWDVDWIQDRPFGPYVGFNVKIQYNIGSIVDASMALRRAILEKVARWPNLPFENYMLDQFLSFNVDQVTNDRAYEAWHDMRVANVDYASRGATLVARFYYDFGWGLAAGLGADIVSVVVTIPDAIAATPEAVQTMYELVTLLPGTVANAIRDPVGNESNYLDGLLPPDRSVPPPPSGPAPEPGGLPELVVPRAARIILRAAGHSAEFVKDVIRFTPEDGVTSPIGFIWRRDLLPGGESAAAAITWVENGARRIPLVGTAQEVRLASGALTTHHSTINRVAQQLARDPNKQYLYIGLNRSTRTMVADAEAGLRLTDNIDRPDIIAVYWDPVNNLPKVEMYEIPSGNQDPNELLEKMRAAMNTLDEQYRTALSLSNVIPRDP